LNWFNKLFIDPIYNFFQLTGCAKLFPALDIKLTQIKYVKILNQNIVANDKI